MHLLNALPQRLDPGATPTFAGLISATLTSPASTNLTLAGGAGNSSIILTPAGTGLVSMALTSGNYAQAFVGSSFAKMGGTYDGNNGWASNRSAFVVDDGTVRGSFQAAAIGPVLILGAETNHPLLFITNNSEKMRVQANGDVSISSATAGASNAGALVVTGGISAGGASYFGGAVTTGGNLMVGSSTTLGTASPTAISVVGRLRSYQGSASVANTAYVDVPLTMPRGLVAYFAMSGGNSAHQSAGFFRANDNGASSNYTLFSQSENSIAVTMSPSAGNIRITNNTGGTETITYTFTMIAGQ